MLMKIAVFPGHLIRSQRGHESIVKRALPLFDEIVIGIGFNTNKHYYFSQEDVNSSSKKFLKGESQIKVMSLSRAHH